MSHLATTLNLDVCQRLNVESSFHQPMWPKYFKLHHRWLDAHLSELARASLRYIRPCKLARTYTYIVHVYDSFSNTRIQLQYHAQATNHAQLYS